MQQWVFQAHLLTTLFMTGLIWFVQLVHYPSFKFFDRSRGVAAAQFHQQRTGWVVMPVMLVELVSALLLLGSSWMYLHGSLLWTNLAALVAIWLVTFRYLVPLHRRLAESYSEVSVNSLVRINWVRTVLWTARATLLIRFVS